MAAHISSSSPTASPYGEDEAFSPVTDDDETRNEGKEEKKKVIKAPPTRYEIDFHKETDGAPLHAFSIFSRNAMNYPERIANRWMDESGVETLKWTYGTLLAKALVVAEFLQTKRLKAGDRVLLVYPPGLEFFVTFWACLALDIIPVPVCPPDPSKSFQDDAATKVQNIFKDCEARCVLTTDFYLGLVKSLFTAAKSEPNVFDLRAPWYVTDSPTFKPSPDYALPVPIVSGDPIAFLQYTSGSTGMSKGVIVTHRNLVLNSAVIVQMFCSIGDGKQSYQTFLDLVVISWLPTFHDMGLVGFHVAPMLCGTQVVYLSPLAFGPDPALWLRLCSIPEFRHIITGAPPFALELCAELGPEELKDIDLSRVDALLIGAEPIRANCCEVFTARFAAKGFREEALKGVFGQAEAVLYAAGDQNMKKKPSFLTVDATAFQENKIVVIEDAKRVVEQPAMGVVRLVSSGQRLRDDVVPNAMKLLIVDPATCLPVADGIIGEIWLTGQCKTRGYWNNEKATTETFRAKLKKEKKEKKEGEEEEWLRTGDMAFLLHEELYVTGRIKEMIIVRGQNIWPVDMEDAVRKYADAGIRPGAIAAISLKSGSPAEPERVAVMVEVDSTRLARGGKQQKKTGTKGCGSKFLRAMIRLFAVMALWPVISGLASYGLRKALESRRKRRRFTLPLTHQQSKRMNEIVQSIHSTICLNFGIRADLVVVLQPNTIPKTSSGKICRLQCRINWENGGFAANTLTAVSTSDYVIPTQSLEEMKKVKDEVTEEKKEVKEEEVKEEEVKEVKELITKQEVTDRLVKLAQTMLPKGFDMKRLSENENISLLEVFSSMELMQLLGKLQKEFNMKLKKFEFGMNPSLGEVVKILHVKVNGGSIATTAATKPTVSSSVPWRIRPPSEVPYLLGIGTALPPTSGGPAETVALLTDRMGFDSKQEAQMKRIVDGTEIQQRFTVLPHKDDVFFNRRGKGNDIDMAARNAVYKVKAIELAVQAAEKTLESWGGPKDSITHIVAASCTGIIIPGLEFHIMTALGLPLTAQRLSINMMGCFGALSGLLAAKGISYEDPRHRILVVCTELCSLHFQLDDRVANLVASALFGDGSAGFVMGTQPRPGEHPLFEFQHSASVVIPDTLPMMTWELSPTGFVIGLDKDIPKQIYENIAPFVTQMLLPTKAKPKECAWAIHPGGSKVLEAIMESMDLTRHDTKYSWDVLHKKGNMSSATLIFVLDGLREAQEKGKIAKGTWITTLAFGPGLSVLGGVLRACGKKKK